MRGGRRGGGEGRRRGEGGEKRRSCRRETGRTSTMSGFSEQKRSGMAKGRSTRFVRRLL
jgi:hypothetical protein